MKNVIKNSLLVVFCSLVLMYIARFFLRTDTFLDRAEMQTFLGTFGTLYGIMTSFVVVQVWNQFNKAKDLVEKEALGLERLYRLTLYFRDEKLSREMFKKIKEYADFIIKHNFENLAKGERSEKAGKIFRELSLIINNIKFDDDHDAIVFHHIIAHYGSLSEIRSDRIKQSLARLPQVLKFFLYISSVIVLTTFVLLPFSKVYWGFFATATFSFIVGLLIQLVEDLNNPFAGQWRISTEPFERMMKHIAEDY